MKLQTTNNFRKSRRNIPQKELSKIDARLEILAENPYNPALDIKKLKTSMAYRMRIGNYRVFYQIEADAIILVEIERRTTSTYN